jgi:PDZ domain-containing protein
MKLKMTPHPIPKYLSRPSLYFLAFILVFTLIAPAPFAIISPGPVTDLLSKGIKISGDRELETSGKLYSLTVFVNNPDSRPPGFFVLQAWLDGQSVVLPNEIIYEVGETTKSADKAAKKSMRTSEVTAAVATANFLKKLNPNEPLNWKASDIQFAMKKVGGPSAGLAFSLALLTKLKSPELIAGRKVAVTGTIDEAGKVGSVGGIDQKLISAKAVGVKIVVIPKANCRDITVETEGLRVIAVSTLSQAFHGLLSSDIAQKLRCPL